MTKKEDKSITLKQKRNKKGYLESPVVPLGTNALPIVKKPKYIQRPIPSNSKLGRPREWTDERIEAEAIAFEEWLQNPDNYYFSEFALDRGYTNDTLLELAKKSALFARTLHRAREIQEKRIVKKSLDRSYDGNFAKFVLANRHGWKEKTEISGDAANPLSFILGNIDGKTKDIIDVTPEVASNGE